MFEWAGLIQTIVMTMVATFAIYFGISGFYYYKYYIKLRAHSDEWKSQPKRWITSERHKEGTLLSIQNLFMTGIIAGSYWYFLFLGKTKVYWNLEPGILYTLFSTFLFWVWMEAGAYYFHRLFHIKPLFQRIHKIHHRVFAPTPFVTMALHPVEYLTYLGLALTPGFLFPINGYCFIGVYLYTFYYQIIEHSGIKMSSIWPWQPHSMYHDDHHRLVHCNFGQNTYFFDLIHGTLAKENRRYGEQAFGGKGEALEGTQGKELLVNYWVM